MAALAEWEQTLTTLVHLRGAALKRYAYLLCGDRVEAEDLVQDALARTFAYPRRSDVVQIEQYVRKVLLNLYLDRARRRQVWQRLLPRAVTPTRSDMHENADLRNDLRTALLGLSARQRACVVLHYYLDLSVQEVSEQLGLSPGTVKRHLHEARGQLAEHLSSTNSPESGYATQ